MGGNDCPDWLLAEIVVLTKLVSPSRKSVLMIARTHALHLQHVHAVWVSSAVV